MRYTDASLARKAPPKVVPRGPLVKLPSPSPGAEVRQTSEGEAMSRLPREARLSLRSPLVKVRRIVKKLE